MTQDLDPATNMPALPPGMFWRVRTKDRASEYYKYRDHPQLELRKKRFIGSRLLWWSYFYGRASLMETEYAKNALEKDIRKADGAINRTADTLSPELIQFHAEVVLKLYNEEVSNAERAASFLGDYPPKKMEAL
jgi:hypothetical protein